MTAFASVDLPAPFGPTRAWMWPSQKSMVRPLRTFFPARVRVTLRTSRIPIAVSLESGVGFRWRCAASGGRYVRLSGPPRQGGSLLSERGHLARARERRGPEGVVSRLGKRAYRARAGRDLEPKTDAMERGHLAGGREGECLPGPRREGERRVVDPRGRGRPAEAPGRGSASNRSLQEASRTAQGSGNPVTRARLGARRACVAASRRG